MPKANETYSRLQGPKGAILTKDKYRNLTMKVGALKYANTWGLYDMHVNVWEWGRDYWGEYSEDPAVDPQGPPLDPPAGKHYVIRGGAWKTDASVCRSASRSSIGKTKRDQTIGFRVALSAGSLSLRKTDSDQGW